MQQKDIDRPLSALELRRLKSFIKGSPDAMGFDEASGFIAAICSAPTTFMPSTWFPVMLGENTFKSEQEAQEIYQLIIRLYNQINISLTDRLQAHPPASLTEVELDHWCAGFLEVCRMDETWGNDEYALEALLPFGVLSGEFEIEGEEDNHGNIIEDDTGHRARYRKLLPERVAEIHQYWTQWRRKHMASTEPITTPKIQRNDQCPCGSGAKYKKCCGR